MAALTDLPAGTWNLDPTHSHIGFTVRHLMVSNVRGSFSEYTSETVAAEPRTDSRLAFTIQTASITTGNADRDAHLRSGDFFDAEAHPTITFTSTAISDSEITGDLTIKGVTKPVTLTYSFDGLAKDPWGGTRAGFEARGEIKRSDFDMSFNAPLETGGVMISDTVKLGLDLEFVLA